jgi:hypothetical protein
MLQQQLCRNCNQKHNCQAFYEQLGSVKGPSVTRKVLLAFALPILFFAAALATSEMLLTGIIENKQLRTAVTFIIASAATLLFISAVKTINKRLNKN